MELIARFWYDAETLRSSTKNLENSTTRCSGFAIPNPYHRICNPSETKSAGSSTAHGLIATPFWIPAHLFLFSRFNKLTVSVSVVEIETNCPVSSVTGQVITDENQSLLGTLCVSGVSAVKEEFPNAEAQKNKAYRNIFSNHIGAA